ncbi:hypothetical protein A10D4_13526, partial [Idiomarina xiamenensis 10-D-4]
MEDFYFNFLKLPIIARILILATFLTPLMIFLSLYHDGQMMIFLSLYHDGKRPIPLLILLSALASATIVFFIDFIKCISKRHYCFFSNFNPEKIK